MALLTLILSLWIIGCTGASVVVLDCSSMNNATVVTRVAVLPFTEVHVQSCSFFRSRIELICHVGSVILFNATTSRGGYIHLLANGTSGTIRNVTVTVLDSDLSSDQGGTLTVGSTVAAVDLFRLFVVRSRLCSTFSGSACLISVAAISRVALRAKDSTIESSSAIVSNLDPICSLGVVFKVKGALSTVLIAADNCTLSAVARYSPAAAAGAIWSLSAEPLPLAAQELTIAVSDSTLVAVSDAPPSSLYNNAQTVAAAGIAVTGTGFGVAQTTVSVLRSTVTASGSLAVAVGGVASMTYTSSGLTLANVSLQSAFSFFNVTNQRGSLSGSVAVVGVSLRNSGGAASLSVSRVTFVLMNCDVRVKLMDASIGVGGLVSSAEADYSGYLYGGWSTIAMIDSNVAVIISGYTYCAAVCGSSTFARRSTAALQLSNVDILVARSIVNITAPSASSVSAAGGMTVDSRQDRPSAELLGARILVISSSVSVVTGGTTAVAGAAADVVYSFIIARYNDGLIRFTNVEIQVVLSNISVATTVGSVAVVGAAVNAVDYGQIVATNVSLEVSGCASITIQSNANGIASCLGVAAFGSTLKQFNRVIVNSMAATVTSSSISLRSVRMTVLLAIASWPRTSPTNVLAFAPEIGNNVSLGACNSRLTAVNAGTDLAAVLAVYPPLEAVKYIDAGLAVDTTITANVTNSGSLSDPAVGTCLSFAATPLVIVGTTARCWTNVGTAMGSVSRTPARTLFDSDTHFSTFAQPDVNVTKACTNAALVDGETVATPRNACAMASSNLTAAAETSIQGLTPTWILSSTSAWCERPNATGCETDLFDTSAPSPVPQEPKDRSITRTLPGPRTLRTSTATVMLTSTTTEAVTTPATTPPPTTTSLSSALTEPAPPSATSSSAQATTLFATSSVATPQTTTTAPRRRITTTQTKTRLQLSPKAEASAPSDTSVTVQRTAHASAAGTMASLAMSTFFGDASAVEVALDLQGLSLATNRRCYAPAGEGESDKDDAGGTPLRPFAVGSGPGRWVAGLTVLTLIVCLIHGVIAFIKRKRTPGVSIWAQLHSGSARWPAASIGIATVTSVGFATEFAASGIRDGELPSWAVVVAVIGALAPLGILAALWIRIIGRPNAAWMMEFNRHDPAAVAKNSNLPAPFHWMLSVGRWSPSPLRLAFGPAFSSFVPGRTVFSIVGPAKCTLIALIASVPPPTSSSADDYATYCRAQSWLCTTILVFYSVLCVALSPRRVPGTMPSHALVSVLAGVVFIAREVNISAAHAANMAIAGVSASYMGLVLTAVLSLQEKRHSKLVKRALISPGAAANAHELDTPMMLSVIPTRSASSSPSTMKGGGAGNRSMTSMADLNLKLSVTSNPLAQSVTSSPRSP